MMRPTVAPSARASCRAALVALALAPAAARAGDNDLALWKLGSPDDLGSGTGAIKRDPLSQEKFARFAGELALAIAPQPAGPAHSLGDSGYELTFSFDTAFIHPRQTLTGTDADGRPFPDEKGQPITAGGVWPLQQYDDKLTSAPGSSTLLVPTLHFRKGLPFSLEMGVAFSYLSFSSMAAVTGNVKWAVVEGFQWWPDIAVRAFGTMLMGSGPLTLVVAGWDAGGSYRFPLAGGAEMTLFGGFQMLGMNASTHNIDFDPRHENTRDPTSDDSVFDEMKMGNPFSPTTAFTRPYFGLRVRWRSLVAGVDASTASGSNLIGETAKAKVQTALWKVAGNLGVVF